MDGQHEGGWGWGGGVDMSFGVQGLRSEFSRPEFTRRPNQTVVFLQFKNDSSSDSSPLIQLNTTLVFLKCDTNNM